jgi:hypothetical protein
MCACLSIEDIPLFDAVAQGDNSKIDTTLLNRVHTSTSWPDEKVDTSFHRVALHPRSGELRRLHPCGESDGVFFLVT